MAERECPDCGDDYYECGCDERLAREALSTRAETSSGSKPEAFQQTGHVTALGYYDDPPDESLDISDTEEADHG